MGTWAGVRYLYTIMVNAARCDAVDMILRRDTVGVTPGLD